MRLHGEMLRIGLVPAAFGCILGGAAMFPVSHALESQLFAIGELDPAAILLSVGILFLAAYGAAAVPARRVTRVEPAAVLRSE